MMNEPPINDLLKKSENRYTLAVEVAKRARQLVEGEQPLYDPRQENPKPMAVAIEAPENNPVSTRFAGE